MEASIGAATTNQSPTTSSELYGGPIFAPRTRKTCSASSQIAVWHVAPKPSRRRRTAYACTTDKDAESLADPAACSMSGATKPPSNAN